MEATSFASGIWGCSWDEVFSEAKLNAQGVANLLGDVVELDIPFGSILDDEMSLFGSLTHSTASNVSYLYGFTQKGDYLVLVDPVLIGTNSCSSGGDSQRVRGSWLLSCKQQFDPRDKISIVRFRLSGLRDWVSESPFLLFLDSSSTSFSSLKYDHENLDKYNHTLFRSDAYEVKLYHTLTYSPLTIKGFNLRHDCEISIASNNLMDFNEMINLVSAFSRLITLSQCRYSQIEKVSFVQGGGNYSVDCFGPFLSCEPFSDADAMRFPFRLSMIDACLQDVIPHFIDEGDDLYDSISLLSSLMQPLSPMRVDSRFLAASQCLEALSKYDVDLSSLPIDVYEQYRQCIKENVKDDAFRRWLLNKTSSNCKGQDKLIKDLLCRFPLTSELLVGDVNRFAKVQRASRNAYTHRSNKRESELVLKNEELYLHTEIILLLCFAVLWTFLGLSEDAVVSAIESSHYKCETIYRAKRLYATD